MLQPICFRLVTKAKRHCNSVIYSPYKIGQRLLTKRSDKANLMHQVKTKSSAISVAALIAAITCGSIDNVAADSNTEFEAIEIPTNVYANLIEIEDKITENLENILSTSERLASVETSPEVNEEISDTSTSPVSTSEEIQKISTPEIVASEVIASVKPSSSGDNLNQTSIQIEQAIQEWVKAWENQDINTYLGHYASEFSPGKKGLSRTDWVEQRKYRLNKPSKIELSLSDIEFAGMTNNVALVIFRQHYQSDSYSDEIVKSLKFINQDNAWKIVSENTVKVIK